MQNSKWLPERYNIDPTESSTDSTNIQPCKIDWSANSQHKTILTFTCADRCSNGERVRERERQSRKLTPTLKSGEQHNDRNQSLNRSHPSVSLEWYDTPCMFCMAADWPTLHLSLYLFLIDYLSFDVFLWTCLLLTLSQQESVNHKPHTWTEHAHTHRKDMDV